MSTFTAPQSDSQGDYDDFDELTEPINIQLDYDPFQLPDPDSFPNNFDSIYDDFNGINNPQDTPADDSTANSLLESVYPYIQPPPEVAPSTPTYSVDTPSPRSKSSVFPKLSTLSSLYSTPVLPSSPSPSIPLVLRPKELLNKWRKENIKVG